MAKSAVNCIFIQYFTMGHALWLSGLEKTGSPIASVGVESGASQRFAYGAQALVEEHAGVSDDRDPGWMLGTVFGHAQKKTMLSCFAADAPADGPVASAAALFAAPGLQGVFVKS